MIVKESKTVKLKTWYDTNASITIGPGFIHRAGWGNFLMPHPPLVNWLLRLGLKENEYYKLSLTHEFSHFQSAPLAVPYTVGLIALAAETGLGLFPMVIIVISTHATWELLSELLTIMHNRQFYRQCYTGISSIPRRAFWIIMSLLTVLGWTITLL